MSPAERILGPLLNPFIGFFADITLLEFVSFLRILSVVLAVLFFFLILIIESKFKKLKNLLSGKLEEGQLPSHRPPPKGPFQKSWEEISKKLKMQREVDYKQAVIQADALMEDIIKRLGFPNIDSALNQKKLTSQHLRNIDELQQAHKTKVKIATEPNFPLSQEEAKRLVGVYETSFKEWGLLSLL